MDNIRFIKASYNEKLGVAEYIADNGDRLLRSGGTIAWRFNNPGNLRPGAKYKLQIGQGKTASGVFLIFPTPEAGREEKRQLLLRKYKDDSISRMLYTYAPPKENDTEAYINTVCKKTGFSRDRVIGELSSDELTKLMHAMEEYEGYHHKKETRKEQWLRTTTVGFSDGARPIADLPVKVKRNQNETLVKTNAYGKLPPFIHFDSEEKIELCVKGGNSEWQTLDPLMLGSNSQTLFFVNDLFTAHGKSSTHNPPISATKQSLVTKYVVQPHDTLSKIASRFKVEASKIQKDNKIKNANLLIAGQILIITRENTSHIEKSNQHTSSDNVSQHNTKITSASRSKDGKGYPLALIPATSKRAPWMEKALSEAIRWAGKKESEITKEQNYHRLVNPKTGPSSLVGTNNAWCASFVNWCLMRAGFQISNQPASSQSFLSDKNFVKIDKPVFGAIVVWSNYVESTGKPDGTGHVGFLYGINSVLGGNQSDAINFKKNSNSVWHHKTKGKMLQKFRGYYVPIAYLDFARSAEEQAIVLVDTAPDTLNKQLGLLSAGTATR